MMGSTINSLVHDQFMLQCHEQLRDFHHRKCHCSSFIYLPDDDQNILDQKNHLAC